MSVRKQAVANGVGLRARPNSSNGPGLEVLDRFGATGFVDTAGGALLGYARTSKAMQEPALQVDALRAADCIRIFLDHGESGGKDSRPELDHLLDVARPGDTVVVWDLSRWGRDLGHLVSSIEELSRRGIGFRSLRENVDTTNAAGRLVLHIFAAVAQFERERLRERVHAGLEAARARGRVGGRPKALDAEAVILARQMRSRGKSISAIARSLHTSRATIYRALEVTGD